MARWKMLVTRWVVEWSAAVAVVAAWPRRDKLYFKMVVVRIITAATICADQPSVRPLMFGARARLLFLLLFLLVVVR